MLAECLRTGYRVTSPSVSCCFPFSGASHFKPFFIQARGFWVQGQRVDTSSWFKVHHTECNALRGAVGAQWGWP